MGCCTTKDATAVEQPKISEAQSSSTAIKREDLNNRTQQPKQRGSQHAHLTDHIGPSDSLYSSAENKQDGRSLTYAPTIRHTATAPQSHIPHATSNNYNNSSHNDIDSNFKSNNNSSSNYKSKDDNPNLNNPATNFSDAPGLFADFGVSDQIKDDHRSKVKAYQLSVHPDSKVETDKEAIRTAYALDQFELVDCNLLMQQIMYDMTFLEELFEIFAKSYTEEMDKLRQKLDERDWANAQLHAHSLKGAGLNLFLPQFKELPFVIELDAKDCKEFEEKGKTEEIEKLIPRMNACFSLIPEYYANFREKLPIIKKRAAEIAANPPANAIMM